MSQESPQNSSGSMPLSAEDLSLVLAHFNDAASKLQTTHEQLQAEVARLKSELKAANDEIERSRRLAALGEMAAGISHEVRNPLGSIRLHARMLEDDLRDRPEERDIAGKILQAVRGLDSVVSDVLAFAKEMRVCKEPCDAEELLRRAVEEGLASFSMNARRVSDTVGLNDAPTTKIEVAIKVSGSGAGEVWCDSGLIHRALVNIVRNSVQAMCPEIDEVGGRDERQRMSCALSRRKLLAVSASSRRVRTPDGGERRMVVLSVRDTGPGLASEVIERMFNPFFTTRASGTGLGLAIVHRIADAHGGTVRVSNHEQGGAVIEIMLPAGVPVEMERGGADVVVKPLATKRASAA